jgi:hypothetical protein
MESIDDILEQIVNQHQEKQQKLNTQPFAFPSTDNSKIMNSQEDNIDDYLSQLESQKKSDKSANTTDDLLQDIASNYQEKKTSQADESDELFSAMENKFQQKQAKKNLSDTDSAILDTSIRHIVKHTQNKIQDTQQKLSLEDSSILDNSIRQIIKHTENKIKQSQVEKTNDNLADIRQEELSKQKQIKRLSRDAEIWLKNLDPNSEEGFWFEQFAMSYESKKEAAIEYLKALNSEDYQ